MSIFKFSTRGAQFGVPFWELEKMRNHMESIYNTLAGSISQIRKNYTGVFPPVNLSEDDEKLYLTAELPGAVKDKLEVSVKGNTLSLKGELRQSDAEAGEEETYHRRERESGGFRRTVDLPVKVNTEGVSAALKNGILTVVMPKAAEAKAHQIEIKTE